MSLFYCLIFFVSRKIFEGFHAKTFLNCYILTILHYIIVLFLFQFNIPWHHALFINVLFIIFYYYKTQCILLKLILYLLIWSIILLVFYVFQLKNYIDFFSLVLFSILCFSDYKQGGNIYEYRNCR